MDQKQIFETALYQSACDLNCRPEDFLKTENVITYSIKNPEAKKYLALPDFCHLVSYGHNVVASIHPDIEEEIKNYLNDDQAFHAFEAPKIFKLQRLLEKYHMTLGYLSVYYLPNLKKLQKLPCQYQLKILNQDDFHDLYLPEWSMALCAERKQLDILGVGAYDQGKLIGLAACSMDAKNMWQIGIDVLPEYRHQGIAASLSSHLAVEILKHDKVPFYACAWANLGSKRTAIRIGFEPAWVEMSALPMEKEENDA